MISQVLFVDTAILASTKICLSYILNRVFVVANKVQLKNSLTHIKYLDKIKINFLQIFFY